MLSNYVPVDWRVSGPSCKPTPFSLEGGAPWSLLVNGKSAYSGRKAGQAGTSCPWEPAGSLTPFLSPILLRGDKRGFQGTLIGSLWRRPWRHVAASGLILQNGAPLPAPIPLGFTRALCKGRGQRGGPEDPPYRICRLGTPRPQEPRQLALGRAGVLAVPAAPTRGSPSLPLSSSTSRSAHTGAPARGRAGGGGRCCPSPSRSRADRPPCCGSRGRLTLSLSPQPSTERGQSSRGEPDGDASCTAG